MAGFGHFSILANVNTYSNLMKFTAVLWTSAIDDKKQVGISISIRFHGFHVPMCIECLESSEDPSQNYPFPDNLVTLQGSITSSPMWDLKYK